MVYGSFNKLFTNDDTPEDYTPALAQVKDGKIIIADITRSYEDDEDEKED